MAALLRIVYDNAADRATVSASASASAALGPANLQNNRKSKVWRSTTTSATLTATWTSGEIAGVVALPFSNLTQTATIRVRGYTNIADAVPVIDTGVVLAANYAPFGMFDWGANPLGVNSYSYSSSIYGVVWFEETIVRKLVIDLVDVDNDAGYIECGRLVTGWYWSPSHNPEYGLGLTYLDSTKHERTDAGGLRTERGTRAKKLSFDLKNLSPTDRSQFWTMLTKNGMATPMFISVHPDESEDPTLEQAYQLFGSLSQSSRVTHQSYAAYATQVEIEEI